MPVTRFVEPSWEGFVIENVLAWAPPGTKAAFYRTAAGAEVDLLLEIPGQRGIWAIEIKRDLSVSVSKGFHNRALRFNPATQYIVVGRYALQSSDPAFRAGPLA